MNNVPRTRTQNMRESPIQKQISEILLMPYPIPLSTEHVATAVMDQMMTSCAALLRGMAWLMLCRPSLICMVPRPREVHTPNRVAITERMSTRSPIQPKILSPMSG